MMYKTITLELIQDMPALYEALRGSKRLLTALDAYATDLRDYHLAWMERLSEAKPASDPRQVSSEAMELAVANLQDHLRSASPKDDTASMAPDAATTLLGEASPPA